MSLYRFVLLLCFCLGFCSSLPSPPSLQSLPRYPFGATSRIFSTRSPRPWSRPSARWSLVSSPSPIPAIAFPPADADPQLASTRCNSSSLPALESSLPRSILLPRGEEKPSLCDAIPDSGNGHTAHSFFAALKHIQSTEFKASQALRTVGLILWLLVLFYLLGTTASDYFSCTLERLSKAWGLSPAVAGVTLLAIGNGAPDVFSSVAAFVSSDQAGSIGFSCVLGGALFITTVVSGTVALVTARTGSSESGTIDPFGFVRDVVFLLVASGALAFVLRDGKVYLWEAIAFLSVYVVYAIVVWVQEMMQNRVRSHFSWESPLLDRLLLKGAIDTSLPQWSSLPQHDPSHHLLLVCKELETEDRSAASKSKHYALLFYKYAIEWPFAMPRRLTIPIIEEQRWSRPLAVASSALAPAFVAGVWMLQFSDSSISYWIAAGVGIGLGVILGPLAFFTTENSRPPWRFLGVWLAGGFLMSVVWFYLIADQLVESLQALGEIFQISPAILGLTVLAWGNCIGDLVADLALACGGREGVQIAVSGCYAGPLFNMVVGLGLSLVIACWRSMPESFLVVDDGSLFYMIGFLVAALAWALLTIPLGGMRLSKSLGCGLILIYGSFLVAGMCYEMGWISAT